MNRYSGAVFVPAFLATALFVFWSFDAAWVGEWNWTIDTITGSTVLTGPLAAALGAHLALTQHRLAAVSDCAARGWQVPYRVALQAFLLSSAVYVVTGAGAIAVTAMSVHGGPFTWWALLVGFLVLAACATVGAAAGHWWPYRVTVLLAAPAVFLFGAFGPHPAANLLRHGPESGSVAGLRFDPAVYWSQAVALVAVVICGCAIALPWRDRLSRGAMSALAVAGVLGLAATLIWADRVGTERFIPSDEHPTACAGSQPRVCVAPSDRADLAAVAKSMRTAAAVLSAGGVKIPDIYEEELPGYRPPNGVGSFWLDADHQDPEDLRTGADNLMTPTGCPAWSDPAGPPPEHAYDARSLITEWVLQQSGQRPSPWNDEVSTWLDDVRGQQTNAWVVATFEDLKSCDLESIRLPWAT